ncbi:MAG: hypothetical protein JXA37_10405 [Chloroflexia bacterium]|nr:hypothetical protein [Chloroflexia bacterium]
MKRLCLLCLLLFLSFAAPGCSWRSPTPLPEADCNWSWGGKPLPDLTEEVRAALQGAGVGSFTVSVQAYSNNCLDGEGRVSWFRPLHTDFYLLLQVDDLQDRAALGDQARQVLTVLQAFSPEGTPGPWPGLIELAFIAPEGNRRLEFSVRRATELIEEGLRGAEMLQALEESSD